MDCLFCELYFNKSIIIYENNLFWSLFDKNPVSIGHALLIPKKHVVSFFDLDSKDLENLFEGMNEVKKIIDKKYSPDAYNIGINDGETAGRTIHHLHIHLIPRYKGDVKNPMGGVRNVIPGKGEYVKN